MLLLVPEEEEGAKAVLHKEKEKDDRHFSAIYKGIMATRGVPSRLPSPQLIVDVAMSGLSRRSLDAEHKGEQHADPQGQFDIE